METAALGEEPGRVPSEGGVYISALVLVVHRIVFLSTS